MPFQYLQNNYYGPGPGPVKYYLNDLNLKSKISIIGYQDIVGHYNLTGLGIEKAIDILEKQKNDYIIFCGCDHPSDNLHTQINQLRDAFEKKLFAITGNGNFINQEKWIFYFPYYWYAFLPGPQQGYKPWIKKFTNFNKSRPYPASCLNNLCRLHRIQLFDKLVEKPYFSLILYSMNSNEANDYYDDPVMQHLISKHKTKLPIFLDRTNYDYGNDMLLLSHPGLHDSYLNIVTENHRNANFISEKIFKPIACGQFFIILGGAGVIELLRKLGFDTFDDIINHDYDKESDPDLRLQQLVSSVDDFMQLNHIKVWDATLQRRLDNATHFFNLDITQNPFRNFLANL